MVRFRLPRRVLLVLYGLALPLFAGHAVWMALDPWLPGELVYDTAPRWAVLTMNLLLVAMIGWRLARLLREAPTAADQSPGA